MNATIHKTGFTLKKRNTVEQIIPVTYVSLWRKQGGRTLFNKDCCERLYINSKITELKSYDKILLAKNVRNLRVTTLGRANEIKTSLIL